MMTKISDRWKTRLPVSLRWPFSALTDASSCDARRNRLPRNSSRDTSTTSSGVAASSTVPPAGSRAGRAGALGGAERIAFQCTLLRGSTQPTSEMNSSR